LTFPPRSLAIGLLLGLAACAGSSANEEPRTAETEAALAGPGSAPAEGETAASPGSKGPAEDGAHDEVLDDSGELDEALPTEEQVVRPHPLDGWSNAQLAAAIEQDLPSLGSMSLGSTNAGALINGVQAEATPLYEPVSPGSAWATRETLAFLGIALSKVHEQFPETRALALGDISGQNGGPARPHISHQSGRDVDIAYFYSDSARWYARGTVKNLDLPRNWAFVRALIADTDVDLILIDRSIQVLLEKYALEQGEDSAWLSSVFRGTPGRLRPIIRHAPGHATHIHIRFFNPIAQETARRCHALLLQAKLTSAPQSYISHRVKKNETLGMISRKYKVSIPTLRASNGLKSSLIREKSVLRVPVASKGPARPTERVSIPARRTPPPRAVAPARDAAAQPPPTR
jgi:penicillin-insensitive murein endopeptidase